MKKRATMVGSTALLLGMCSIVYTAEPVLDSKSMGLMTQIVEPNLYSFDPKIAQKTNAKGGAAATAEQDHKYGKLPLSFQRNNGQADSVVEFLARGPGYSLFLTRTEAVLSLNSPSTNRDQPSALHLQLVGTGEASEITGLDPFKGRVNYLIGNDPTRWQTDIPTFGKVIYRDVYDGIDLLFHGNQRQLEYDWIIAPYAKVRRIQMRIAGALKAELDAAGNLVLNLAGGAVQLKAPYSYQEINGQRISVPAKLLLSQAPDAGTWIVGIAVEQYDPTRPLIIDPVISYSTYLGTNSADLGYGIAVDTTGAAYLTGYTRGDNFPKTDGGSIQGTRAGENDVFVAKINAAGTELVYATYLGTTSDDIGRGIAVDSTGAAYITGYSDGMNFPGIGQDSIQSSPAGMNDAFVAKLNVSGTALEYATYLGTNDQDHGLGIVVDSGGAAYVIGRSQGSKFPGTTGSTIPSSVTPIQGTFAGAVDVFVVKLNTSGTALDYSTYLGGMSSNSFDVGYAIAVDSSGAAYITGEAGPDFQGTSGNPIQAYRGEGDAFVAKINAAGTAITWAAYLGTSDTDVGISIAVDVSGNAYVAGLTTGSDFTGTSGSLIQNAYAGGRTDAFAAKINASGTAVDYATYLGTSADDRGYGIAVDSAGAAHIIGYTDGDGFPGTGIDSIQGTRAGGNDVFVVRINPAGTALSYSTYLGTPYAADIGYGIAVDGSGAAYLIGETSSGTFPGTGDSSIQSRPLGSNELFVTKIVRNAPTAPTNLVAVDRPNDPSRIITLTWTPSASAGVNEQRIYRSERSGGYTTALATLTDNTSISYTDATASDGTTYYYVVRAFGGTDESNNSNEATTTPVLKDTNKTKHPIMR